MHEIRLNITEEINSVPFYPSISFEEAKSKIENSIENISKNQGQNADLVFNKLLS